MAEKGREEMEISANLGEESEITSSKIIQELSESSTSQVLNNEEQESLSTEVADLEAGLELAPDDAMAAEASELAPEGLPTAVTQDVDGKTSEAVSTADTQVADDKPIEETSVVAEEMNEDESGIKITVRSPQEKKDIIIDPNANILELKRKVSRKFNTPIDRLCLIFAGKILTDDEDLVAYDIVEDTTVHLVVKSIPNQPPSDSKTSASEEASSTETPTVFTPSQFATLGINSSTYVQMQQEIQRQMSSNPELIQQMVDNPVVQNLMMNPAVMRDIINSSPHTRELYQRNPEISQMLNDPEVMKTTFEMARNPAMLQELLAAQRVMMHPSVGAIDTTRTPRAGTTSNAPLWSVMGGLPDMAGTWAQIAQNPQMLQQMLAAPYMQTMLQGLTANPQLAQSMIASHPMFASNPQLQQQMIQMMPYYLYQLQTPELQTFMTSPRSLQAMMRIQQAMDVLQTEAPNLVGSLGLPFMSMPPSFASFSAHASGPETGKQPDPPAAPGLPQDPITLMMSQMVQQMAAGQINQAPEQRYKDQLEQLVSMGFANQQVNLQVLIGTFGDLSAAIEQLTQRRGQTQP